MSCSLIIVKHRDVLIMAFFQIFCSTADKESFHVVRKSQVGILNQDLCQTSKQWKSSSILNSLFCLNCLDPTSDVLLGAYLILVGYQINVSSKHIIVVSRRIRVRKKTFLSLIGYRTFLKRQL